RNMPQFHSGYSNAYDMRESRISAPQEIAVGFAEEMAYIDGALQRGLEIDDFEPRRSIYFSAHTDIFEEIAKLRAARRMWARLMDQKYGAQNEATRKLRFGVHTGGSSLFPQQPLNNIVRVAYQALAAILGGAQSLHCCSYDEPVAIPTEQAQMIALRTQQILAHEAGAANVADPLGGSYYVEALTDKVEAEATAFLDRIEQRGGFLAVAKSGWLQGEMDAATLAFQDEVEADERILVGVNAYTTEEEEETPGGVFRVSADSERLVVERLKRLRARRDPDALAGAMARLRDGAAAGEAENLIPAMIDALRAKATKAEIGGIVRQAYGYSYDPLGMLENPF
ncbi:MAG: methylmalonyl-CoA mutase family protein, partial [Alphaproteobacteria bacterium]|nr:methylmalonyl-CoA mutase family protein [Alphaproteobacteria bacterium]